MSPAEPNDLERRVSEACGHLHVAHGQMVGLVIELLQNGSWEVAGIRSPEHWLIWKTGVSRSRAIDLVLLASRAGELVETIATLNNAMLSFEQAVTIARYAPAGYDAQACELAKSLSVPQLASVLRRYSFTPRHHDTVADDPAPANTHATPNEPSPGQPRASGGRGPSEERTAEPNDRLSAHFDDVGRFRISGDLNALHGAEIDAALRQAHDALYRAGKHDVTWADALVEVCRRSLAATGSVSRSERYRVYLHITPTSAWINGGPILPAAVRSQVLCDTTLHLATIKDGTPINIGRATRTIPAHTRRAVIDRDQVCRFPGCVRRHIEVHHLIHWEHDGTTDMSNLVSLCSDHHHRHHDGTYTIEGDPHAANGLVFRHRNGSPFISGPNPTPPTGPPPAPPNKHAYRHPSGEHVQTRWIDLTPRPPSAGPPVHHAVGNDIANDNDDIIRYGTADYDADLYQSDTLNDDLTWKATQNPTMRSGSDGLLSKGEDRNEKKHVPLDKTLAACARS